MSERSLKQPFVVVAALIERDGKILFGKQGQGNANGLWDLPAGWVDLGEDLRDAVIRETKEETGLEFTPTSIVGIYSYIKQSRIQIGTIIQPITFAFRGTSIGNLVADGREVLDHAWFTLSEIQAMDQTVLRSLNTKRIIKDYFDNVNHPLTLIQHEIQA